MEKLTLTCDRCGAEITAGDPAYSTVGTDCPVGREGLMARFYVAIRRARTPRNTVHLCETCRDKLFLLVVRAVDKWLGKGE